ncbi:MAG: hypothetical protein PHD31_02445 [Candidatus Pacebacteria bacterium]|nr:hypothetical protein [Candidatus Paceibacterota bacterium]
MKKLFTIIVLFLFIGFYCYASDGIIDFFVNKIIYLKNWMTNEQNIKAEFNKELGELKIETSQLVKTGIPQLWIKIKALLPSN